MLKQLLVSLGGGLLLLCLWGAVVVATSQDFPHEGPNSVWFSPVEAWSGFLVGTGWSRWVSPLGPVAEFLVGITLLLGPFVLALSAAAHLATWLLRRMVPERKFR